MGPVENNINLLIAELNKDQITKEHALDYLGHVFRLITTNNISLDQRHGASMTVDEFLKRARGGDFRFADGFYGNWAKQLEEEKGVDSFDVNDIGC
jgi:hypothetical protein